MECSSPEKLQKLHQYWLTKPWWNTWKKGLIFAAVLSQVMEGYFLIKKGQLSVLSPFLTMATEDSKEYNLQKYTFDLLLFEIQRLYIASG